MKNIGTICGHFFPASCVSASIVTTFEETIERQLSCSCEDINSWSVSSLPPSDACVFRTKIITSKKGSPSHVDFRPVLARITKAVLQFSCYRLRVVVSTASNGKVVCLWKQQVSLMHNNGTMSCPVFESTLASWVLNDSYQHVFVIPLYIPQFDGVLTLFRNRKMLKFIKRFRENNCFWVTFPAKVWNAPVSATTPENYAKNVPLKMANAKDAAKTRQKTTHEIYFSILYSKWSCFRYLLVSVGKSCRSKHGFIMHYFCEGCQTSNNPTSCVHGVKSSLHFVQLPKYVTSPDKHMWGMYPSTWLYF